MKKLIVSICLVLTVSLFASQLFAQQGKFKSILLATFRFHHGINLLFDKDGAFGDVFDDFEVFGRKEQDLSPGKRSFILCTLSISDDWYFVAMGMMWFMARSPSTRASICTFLVYILTLLRRRDKFFSVITPVASNISDSALFQISIEDDRHVGFAV